MANRRTGSLQVQAGSRCGAARDGVRTARRRSTRRRGAPPQRDQGTRLSLRGSLPNPVIILGDVIGSKGCCAHRVLVHDEYSPPVHSGV